MKNIEKYKKEIIESDMADITCCVNDDIMCNTCYEKCRDCKKHVMDWLLEEYKEPILTDVERKYLSTVIKPFREKIKTIEKYPFCGLSCKKEEYIIVRFHDGGWSFPRFTANTMYKGMEVYKSYTLKELGL